MRQVSPLTLVNQRAYVALARGSAGFGGFSRGVTPSEVVLHAGAAVE